LAFDHDGTAEVLITTANGSIHDRLSKPDLRWEKKELNTGIDFSIHSRMSGALIITTTE
jgi:hypothetical protein